MTRDPELLAHCIGFPPKPSWWQRHGWKVIRAVLVLLAVLLVWRMIEGNETQNVMDALRESGR